MREDYFGLLYLEKEHNIPRDKALNQVAFGGNDYGIDGFHFDPERRNLYLFQFKWSDSHALFKGTFIEVWLQAYSRIPVIATACGNPTYYSFYGKRADNRFLAQQDHIPIFVFL